MFFFYLLLPLAFHFAIYYPFPLENYLRQLIYQNERRQFLLRDMPLKKLFE